MNEQELANRIVQHLERGLDQLKQGTAYKLQSARLTALDRYRDTPRPVLGLAWAGAISHRLANNRHFNVRNLLVLGALLISLTSITSWQIVKSNDTADIDASLLAGDLPIDAYLDSGFEAWLKRSSQ